jgi:tetratricopeptide (TPR) repeat protein
MANQSTPSGDERLESIGKSLSKAEQFLVDNKKIITYIVGGIAILILGYWAYMQFIHKPKVRQAESDMYMAQIYYEMDSLNLALNGDGTKPGFLDIIDEYGNTPSGNLANYYVGMIYLKQGKFEDAIEYLEEFDGDDQMIGPMATGCIGDAHMELGDKEAALEKYLEAADQSENSFTTPMYLMRAGWVYEDLGEWEEALKVYERIEKEYYRSYEAMEIKKYISRAKTMVGPTEE